MRTKKNITPPEEVVEKPKIKWFKAVDINELQNAILKKKYKIKKQVDISKMKMIRIDHVTISIDNSDVIYSLEDITNNNYIADWKQGPGKFIRKDIKKNMVIRPNVDFGPYVEICYSSKEGFLKKALIRIAYELQNPDLTEEQLKDEILEWEKYHLLNGKINNLDYTIIKIVGADENYSKKEILSRTIENLEDLATTDFVEYQEEPEDDSQTALF